MDVAIPEDEFLLTPQPLPLGERLSDTQCHALAYQMAFAGLGWVAPNPLVGCVITDMQGRLLAVGAHRRYGAAHAEVEAITQALARAGEACLRQARIFVTLQPCTHHGKTPPCSELLQRYQPRQVFFGAYDPNPQVGAITALQQAGIACHKYEHRELRWLDEPYFFHAAQTRARPFVAVKIAATLDGSFAAPHDQPRLRLSCKRALRYGHFLRQRYDAIMVGTGTLRRDNPRLDVRVPFPRHRNPQRVVLANVELLQTSKLRVVATDPDTVIVAVPAPEAKHAATLLPRTVRLLPLPQLPDGRLDLSVLLETLYREHKIYSILLEGGGRLWQSFFAAGLVDKLHLLQSPRVDAICAAGLRKLARNSYQT